MPLSNNITFGPRNGWFSANETWTYNTVSGILGTINVPNSALYPIGTRIWINQTTDKYFVVVAQPSGTTINVTGGTTYSLANAAIVSPYFSLDAAPVGYPTWFAWTPTLTPTGSMTYTSTSITYAKFQVIGKEVRYAVAFTGTVGGTPSIGLIFTIPVTAIGTSGLVGSGLVVDGGTGLAAYLGANSTTSLNFVKYNASTFTAGTVACVGSGFYEIP